MPIELKKRDKNRIRTHDSNIIYDDHALSERLSRSAIMLVQGM